MSTKNSLIRLQIIFLLLSMLLLRFSAKAQDSTQYDSFSSKGTLLVHIENAEQDNIIGATVQVMKGNHQVSGAITDLKGYRLLGNIERGSYLVVVSNVVTGTDSFQVAIEPGDTSIIRYWAETVKRLNPLVVDEQDPRKNCNEPFFDPYGQPKPKRGWLYFEIPSIDW